MNKNSFPILIVASMLVIVGTTSNRSEAITLTEKKHGKSLKIPIENKKTEIYVLGTVHFETDSIKRQDFYKCIDSISPTVILYEGDSSTVRRFLKGTDYFARIIDATRNRDRIEKPVVRQYIKNNPDCCVLPYEWELRDKYHRKYKLREKSKELINRVIRLHRKNSLDRMHSKIIDDFLALNKVLLATEREANISDINHTFTDHILEKRQEYIYKKIPKIALELEELKDLNDFVPIHMEYWDRRNMAMVKNILRQIEHHPNEVFIVLTGFYHRYYLINELKAYQSDFNFTLKYI